MRYLAAAIVVALAYAGAVRAQPASPESSFARGEALTLDRALALAIAYNPAREIAIAGSDVANATRTIAGLRPNPELQSQVENVGGSGSYRRLDSAESTVGLALPVELGGKRSARIGVADAQGARMRIDGAAIEADLRLRVTRSFIDVSAATRRLDVARDQLDIAQSGLKLAGARVRAGRASPIEEQRAGLSLINAGTAADAAKRSLDLARANLTRLIGIAVDTLDGAWFDRIAKAHGPRRAVDVETTLAVAAADADALSASAQVRLARSRRTPDIVLSASARRLEATNDTAAVFALSIPIPLFNNGSAAVHQANAERRRAEALLRGVRLDAEAAIDAARTDVENAAAQADTAGGAALAAAQEGARIARIGYREGKFGQLDLIEAERALAQTRSAAIDALSSFHDAQARLERLTTAAPVSTRD